MDIEALPGDPVLALLHPLAGRHGCAGAGHGDPPLWGAIPLPDPGGEPGPGLSKLVPKQSSDLQDPVYHLLRHDLLWVVLKLAGMPLYDAFIHAFSTAGTGGFSTGTPVWGHTAAL